MNDEHPIEDHYDSIAESWEEIVTAPTREHILWPAIETLLPDLTDKRVLDAGCGSGAYSAWLADHGAAVLGIDVSQEMIRVARENYGDRAEFRHADLQRSLDTIEADSFDVILCLHVFSRLPDLETPLAEFARVLFPGGTLVLSTHHPFHDFLVVREQEYPDLSAAWDMDLDSEVRTDVEQANYHETERYEISWGAHGDSVPGTYYRRPLSRLLQPLLDSGFDLRKVSEPTPTDAFRREYPAITNELLHHPPEAICLRAELD